MISAKVRGDKELADAMLKMANGLNMDIKKVVPIAGYVASRQGQKICAPGEKMRKMFRRKRNPDKKKISRRTDTSRTSTHWIMFYRQNKKPFFVPVNPNPFTRDDGLKPTDPDKLRKWDSARKKRAKINTPSVYNYQQTRKSTLTKTKRQTILAYDTPAEIASMRKIGRRGLAGELWAYVGNQTGGKKFSPKIRGDTGRVTRTNRDAIDRHSKKYGKVTKRFTRTEASMRLVNGLTYLTKAYPNAERRIVSATAPQMEKEMKNRIIRRQKALEKRAQSRAA